MFRKFFHFAVLTCLTTATGCFLLDPWYENHKREVYENSQQYVETQRTAFAAAVAGIRDIDVQLASMPHDAPQYSMLQAQREFLVGEASRAVDKIPYNARSADMYAFGTHK